MTADAIRVVVSRPADPDALGPAWRAHEDAFGASFFQSWTWTGCLAPSRLTRPVLIQAFRGDALAGMAVFNRHRGRLHLGETGNRRLDQLTVEHNGVLTADPEARAACLRAAFGAGWGVVLSGVGSDQIEAAQAADLSLQIDRTSPAPFVDLAGLRAAGRPYLDGIGAGTRYQLRRSLRRFQARGSVRLHRAPTAREAHAALDALIALHQADWRARGKPGAFADPSMRSFHHALIDRGFARGEIDLWHATAGEATIGRLYNFRHRGKALAYQSGFAHDFNDLPNPGHAKPGLTCHHLAIEAALADGLQAYDFLAGDARYKRNLADSATELHWATLPVPGSPDWFMARILGPLRWARRRL